MSEPKCLTVSAIKDVTVIDHIPAESTIKIMELLKLSDFKELVSVAFNLESKSIGKKGIIKIASRNLTKKEIDKISMIAPGSTLNVIANYKVKEKLKLVIPDEIIGVAKCINPNCITNIEDVKTKFVVLNKDPLKTRCEFCERLMDKDELQIKHSK
jgi:aspartate carbamoyltransferase regulatory subunit